jgi:hypothetical protein
MDADYDEWWRDVIDEGLERALRDLTPEQLPELEDRAEDIASTAVSEAIDATARAMVDTRKNRRSGNAGAPSELADEVRAGWRGDYPGGRAAGLAGCIGGQGDALSSAWPFLGRGTNCRLRLRPRKRLPREAVSLFAQNPGTAATRPSAGPR